jgi:molybdopterin/thiamine biosynthesis adenylyltransferase/rhodanese-related sulfurtransferase
MDNSLTTDEIRRYSRHLALPDFNKEHQVKLKNARVLVIGAGGLGSPLLLYLTAAGIGTIGIIEGDTVDISNLQRQILYRDADTGKSKIKATEEELTKLNPHIKLELYPTFLTKENALDIISRYDIVADGSDNFGTRYLVNDACVLLGKPLAYGAVFRYEGQLAVLNAIDENGNYGPNYRNLFPEPPAPDSIPNCAEGGVLGVLPGIIGSMQAGEVIKYITGTGKILNGRLYIFNLHNFTSQTVDFSKTEPYKIESLGDYNIECNINTETMKEVTVQELKEMMDNKEDFQLIDVRESHEYDIANINGELIPLNQVPFAEDKISKEKKVVVHCRSGARSAQAIKALEQRYGYDNLYNLKGGILAWADEIDPEVKKY